MKKNIVIAGPPRSGKSTLSQLAAREFGYAHVAMDAVVAGITRAFPQLGIDPDAPVPHLDNLRFISGHMAGFINAMMEDEDYDQSELGMAIDICQLLPEDFARCVDRSLCDVFFLGTADATAQERLALLDRHDAVRDYSYRMSLERRQVFCAELVEHSRLVRDQCAAVGLSYFDIARDREAVFEGILASIRD